MVGLRLSCDGGAAAAVLRDNKEFREIRSQLPRLTPPQKARAAGFRDPASFETNGALHAHGRWRCRRYGVVCALLLRRRGLKATVCSMLRRTDTSRNHMLRELEGLRGPTNFQTLLFFRAFFFFVFGLFSMSKVCRTESE